MNTTPNPFLNGDMPPSERAMTLFLGARAGRIMELVVSFLERGLEPVWVWFGEGFGWGLQAQNDAMSLMTIQARDRPMVATLAFPVDQLDAVHKHPDLSLRSRRLVPLTVKNVPAAFVSVDLEDADGVDVALELLDARTCLLTPKLDRLWS
jgi:hypothetical protein